MQDVYYFFNISQISKGIHYPDVQKNGECLAGDGAPPSRINTSLVCNFWNTPVTPLMQHIRFDLERPSPPGIARLGVFYGSAMPLHIAQMRRAVCQR